MTIRTTHLLAGLAAIATIGSAANAQQMMSQDQSKKAAPKMSPSDQGKSQMMNQAAPAAATAVTDQEVTEFAKVYLGIRKMRAGNANMDPQARQKAMMSLLQTNNLDPKRFNQIAMAVRSNKDLQARIGKAVSELSKAG